MIRPYNGFGVSPTGAAFSRLSLGFRGGGASPAVYTCSSLISCLFFENLGWEYLTKSASICHGHFGLPGKHDEFPACIRVPFWL